jgi:site-specific DNA recombinase
MTENNEEVQLRVAFYLRVSSDDQVEKYGLPMQREALEGLLRSKGNLKNGTPAMILAGENYVYKDEGISGTLKIEERPAFARLKEDIMSSRDNRPFDVVIVYKLDRFARRLKVLLDVVDLLEDYDIKFISATESIDTSTPFGRAMIGIIGVISELELENIKARTQGGKEEARKLGRFMGTAPFGYKKDSELKLEVSKEEAEIVKMIFDMYVIQKLTLQQIASYLTKSKYPSPEASAINNKKKGGEMKKKNDPYFWRAEKVGKMLEDEVYTGLYYYNKNLNKQKLPKNKWILSQHKHEAIIDIVTFEKAKRLLDKSRQYKAGTSNPSGYVYLLRGLIRCDACKDSKRMMNWIGSKKLIDKSTQKYSYSYHCGGKNTSKSSHVCKTIPFPAEEVEVYVLNFVKRLLNNPKAVYEYQQKLKSTSIEIKFLEKERKHLQDLIEGLPNRKKNILEQNASGYLTKTNLDKQMEEMRVNELETTKKIKEIERKMAENALSTNYIKIFETFRKKYMVVMDKTFIDREEVSNLLHIMIEDIIVYSRPINEKDVIAGQKKEGQLIPHKIDIKFRLPQEMLEDLVKMKESTVLGEDFRSESRTGVEPIYMVLQTTA